MAKTPKNDAVSAEDAGRRFFEILQEVREGRVVTVTSDGDPIARIVPIERQADAFDGARAALLARLRAEPVVTVGPWSREQLYENGA